MQGVHPIARPAAQARRAATLLAELAAVLGLKPETATAANHREAGDGNLDASTIEDVYEPFLVQHGFLQRTPRGRIVTAHAYRHLGFTPPTGAAEQPGLF